MGVTRGAGLRHAWIRTPDGTYHDIDAIISIEGELEIDTTDVEGDDQVLTTFGSLPTKSLTVVANSLSPEVLGAITGQAPTDIATTGKVGQEIGLGGEGEANPPFVELGGLTVGRLKEDDAAQTIKRIFHRVQLRATSHQMEKDSEFNTTFEGTAFPTATDITGTALAYKRIETVGYSEEDVDAIIATQEA